MKQVAIEDVKCDEIIKSIRSRLGLSQENLARVLDVSLRTIIRWETEGDDPPPLQRERLELIDEVVLLAADIMEKSDIVTWFASSKEMFSGKKPIELLSSYRGIQQIKDAIERVRFGIF